MLTAWKPLRCSILILALAVAGCRAQTAASAKMPANGANGALSPELARRVEVLIRAKSSVPPNYDIAIGPRTKSEMPGFEEIAVEFKADGKTSKPVTFLISTDGKTLAQFTKFDISKDPKLAVSAENRPSRGGPANAPVVIVGFDDLECPFCAKMHAELFPAVLDRYKNQVRVVYRDFPLEQHPWAMRAAIDTNCVGAQSVAGYWSLVDYIHQHAGEFGGDAKSLAKANDMLDTLARDEGKRDKVNLDALNACLAKQDRAAVQASIKDATALGVDSTPALFINGEKLEGAVPLEYVYRMIDQALVASGQTPPATPTVLATPTGPVHGGQSGVSGKPGS